MTALSFVPFLPPTIRYTLPFGLLYVEFAPVLYQYGMRRFSRMDDAAAERYMAALDRSHGPFQMAYQGIRSLVMISFYQQPEVLEVLEVDWRARASELIERRARLLRMAPELGNPKNARTNAERDARTHAANDARMSDGHSVLPRAIDGSGAEEVDGDDEPSTGDAAS